METIHERIKALRQKQGLTMQALADKVGVKSWQTIQQWEGGGKKPTAPTRSKQAAVAKALGVTVTELMFGRDSSDPLDATLIIDEAHRTRPPSVVQVEEMRKMYPNIAAEDVISAAKSLVDKILEHPPLTLEDIHLLEKITEHFKLKIHTNEVTKTTNEKTITNENQYRQTSLSTQEQDGKPHYFTRRRTSTESDEKKSLGGKPEGWE